MGKEALELKFVKPTKAIKSTTKKKLKSVQVPIRITRSRSDEPSFEHEVPLLTSRLASVTSNLSNLSRKSKGKRAEQKNRQMIFRGKSMQMNNGGKNKQINCRGRKKIKKAAKKSVQKAQKAQKAVLQNKLRRGYKLCKNCYTTLNIHKHVCPQCGHIHDMKKHKLDVMKNLAKGTPKIIRSVLQAHQFNQINFPSAFGFQNYENSLSQTFLQATLKRKSSDNRRQNRKNQKFQCRKAKTQGTLSDQEIYLKFKKSKEQKTFKATNSQDFEYLKLENTITCLQKINVNCQQGGSPEIGILIVESVEKKAKQVSSDYEETKVSQSVKNNQTTVKSFKLEGFHQIGKLYEGKSQICYTRIVPAKTGNYNVQVMSSKIRVDCHIESLKSCSNKIAVLTGQKSIIIFNLKLEAMLKANYLNQTLSSQIIQVQTKFPKKSEHALMHFQQFSTGTKNQLTCLEWLKLSFLKGQSINRNKGSLIYLVTGSIYGHILIYAISAQNQISLYRSIINAHFQMVNCLAECPLSEPEKEIFASGSYDGSAKVWAISQRQCLFRFQASNRKIQDIQWDSGAKYILIIRDQNIQSCYLGCFFSIDKIEAPLKLSENLDFRMIRSCLEYQQFCTSKWLAFQSNTPLISYPVNSKICVFLNSRSGVLKVMQAQQLRRVSLKRKKSKKADNLFTEYRICLKSSETQDDCVMVQKVQPMQSGQPEHNFSRRPVKTRQNLLNQMQNIDQEYAESGESKGEDNKHSEGMDGLNKKRNIRYVVSSDLAKQQLKDNQLRGQYGEPKAQCRQLKAYSGIVQQPTRRSLRIRNTTVSLAEVYKFEKEVQGKEESGKDRKRQISDWEQRQNLRLNRKDSEENSQRSNSQYNVRVFDESYSDKQSVQKQLQFPYSDRRSSGFVKRCNDQWEKRQKQQVLLPFHLTKDSQRRGKQPRETSSKRSADKQVTPALPKFSKLVLFTPEQLQQLHRKPTLKNKQASVGQMSQWALTSNSALLFISSLTGHLIKRTIKILS